jgi:hypothetical protein
MAWPGLPNTREEERDTTWDHEAIHLWFGLSYANYLVLPRSVLQSMPDEWQKQFVLLLNEAQETFDHLEWPNYEVTCLAHEPELVHFEACPDCEDAGLIGIPCETCDGEGEVECDYRYETGEEVGYRVDPIPHYNRGRTRIPIPEKN